MQPLEPAGHLSVRMVCESVLQQGQHGIGDVQVIAHGVRDERHGRRIERRDAAEFGQGAIEIRFRVLDRLDDVSTMVHDAHGLLLCWLVTPRPG